MPTPVEAIVIVPADLTLIKVVKGGEVLPAVGAAVDSLIFEFVDGPTDMTASNVSRYFFSSCVHVLILSDFGPNSELVLFSNILKSHGKYC